MTERGQVYHIDARGADPAVIERIVRRLEGKVEDSSCSNRIFRCVVIGLGAVSIYQSQVNILMKLAEFSGVQAWWVFVLIFAWSVFVAWSFINFLRNA